jgi:hypothetical protein
VRDDSVEQKACGNAFMMVIVHVKELGLWPSWVETEAGSIVRDDRLSRNHAAMRS